MNDERRPAESEEPASTPARWPALFPRSQDPLFLLNQHRRLLRVNRAFEEASGLTAAELRGLLCSLKQLDSADAAQALAAGLTPPGEVLAGQPGRVRRLMPLPAGRSYWDIDFLPLHDARGRLRVLGKVSPSAVEPTVDEQPVPGELLALRESLGFRYRLDDLVGAGPALRRVREQARLAGSSRVPVLIVGAAGTGKGWLARAIHHAGAESTRYFAALDAGRLPALALEQVLFGLRGLTQRADLATLVLHEPGDMPLDLQARLADWLDESPAGGPRLIATARGTDATQARFLDRLQARLSTLVITLPPLGERREDLREWIDRLGAGEAKLELSAQAWEALRAYTWPGNLRELRGVLLQLGQRVKGRPVDLLDLPAHIRLLVAAQNEALPAPLPAIKLDEVLEQVEKRLITLAMARAKGNKSKAAEFLSIWRPRLLRRLEALGLSDKKGDDPGDREGPKQP